MTCANKGQRRPAWRTGGVCGLLLIGAWSGGCIEALPADPARDASLQLDLGPPPSDSGDRLDARRPDSGVRADATVGDPPETGTGGRPDGGDSGSGGTTDSGTGPRPDSGAGDPPDSGAGDPPDSGAGDPPDSGVDDPPDSGAGDPPDSGAGDPPDSGDPPDDPCGTWEDPCSIEDLPALIRGDTSASPSSTADRYSPCAPGTAEDGPELVYQLTPPSAGLLQLTLDDRPGDDVDVDVHLLSARSPDSCLGRDNVTLTRPVEAGQRYWIVIDSWFNGARALPGPFTLTVTLSPLVAGDCPEAMAPLQGGTACIDRYEAPGRLGELPLVMYTYVEAQAWCGARGKRLCYDDEWTIACRGAAGTDYPYGTIHEPGVCRDEARWRQYDQTLLNGWPAAASRPATETLAELLGAARQISAGAAAAANHVEALYQGAAAGDYLGCVNELGVFDLTGNVEEWTTRRDGGVPSFHGNLKGRYWAETRTCSQGVTTHGDGFRFYEIGFRCCQDR